MYISQNGNTALHLAAGAGLKECVELLLGYQADMAATNQDGLTPADLAKAKQQAHIASSLEAKMVFSVSWHELSVILFIYFPYLAC